MSILKSHKPLMATLSVDGAKEDFEVITVKEAAQRAQVGIQNIEYLLYDKGEGGVLDVTYPSQHDGDKSGPKYVVCNPKWFDYLKKPKKNTK
jgi:hypothetical protein